jgi:poly(A) polymerase
VNVRLEPAIHPWMTEARTRSVMRALKEAGGQARFVGGAVRNALLGEPVMDIDIATPLVPQEVTRRLQAAGLGAVPTGIEHGTVTAVAGGKPFEVTTLRRDVETDGRRAVVAFTTDWKEDASRRDFTMNALYADEEGTVFDYFGGIEDLRSRRVRFVGEPELRIREDYLRILRLFRFHAWYGKGEIDADALAAAKAQKAGLRTLSGERVQKELLRLLQASNPLPAIEAMIREDIMMEILSHTTIRVLENLVAIQRENKFPPEPLLRLAACLPDYTAAIETARKLRLSNADRDRLIAALGRRDLLGLGETSARVDCYNMGASSYRDAVILRWARNGLDAAKWKDLEAFARAWTVPQFPLNGGDVKALNIAEGPEVGALLDEMEKSWIESDFKDSREVLLARLKQVAKKQEG